MAVEGSPTVSDRMHSKTKVLVLSKVKVSDMITVLDADRAIAPVKLVVEALHDKDSSTEI